MVAWVSWQASFNRICRSTLCMISAIISMFSVWWCLFQDHQGISNAAPADAPLRSLCISKAENGSEIQATNNVAEPEIHDYISSLRFCISPTAFFQVGRQVAVFFMLSRKNLSCNSNYSYIRLYCRLIPSLQRNYTRLQGIGLSWGLIPCYLTYVVELELLGWL